MYQYAEIKFECIIFILSKAERFTLFRYVNNSIFYSLSFILHEMNYA